MLRKIMCVIFAALLLVACVFKVVFALFGVAFMVLAWLI